jgi:lysophospholipase L1-like esterase
LISFKVLLLNILIIVTFPILLVQGLLVRKKTLKLPEPTGKRVGCCQCASNVPNKVHLKGDAHSGVPVSCQQMKAPLALLIAGDSAAAGVGVSTQEQALSGWLINSLSENFCVNWELKAKTGVNSTDLLSMLQRAKPNLDPTYYANSTSLSTITSTHSFDTPLPCRSFDVAVISIGVNDVTGFTSWRRWRSNVTQIIEILKARYQCRLVVFTALPPMHEFPALPQPLRWVLGQRAKYLNTALLKLVNKYHGVNVLTLTLNPIGNDQSDNTLKYMAEDGFHPQVAGYQLWSNAVVKLVNEELDELVGKNSNVG